MSDFQASLASVQPSAKREGFATVPDVTWDDVGALQDIREELTMAILVCNLSSHIILVCIHSVHANVECLNRLGVEIIHLKGNFIIYLTGIIVS